MKYKHENTIKNVGILTFILTMIFMKVSNISAQLFITGILCIVATLFGIFFIYKNFKIGAELMFFIALMGLVGFLSQYFNNYNISVLTPAMFIALIIFSYRMIVKIGDEEQIVKMKKMVIIGVISCLIFQFIVFKQNIYI
jgi:hypothetical protein